MNPAAWLASWPLGAFVGFGYRPVLTVYWAITVVAAGWWLLPDAKTEYTFKQRDPEPPPFNALAYSVDAFLPIDLRQVTSYTPKDSGPNLVLWLETGFGWLLAALLLAAVTGVLRRD
jgi:hypothetical protein